MTEITAPTKKFQKELNSGTSSLVLLSVLSRSKEAMYGYQIAKLLEESGPEIPMMKQGTLYPVLRSLEENGLLESTVEPSVSGPPRRYYQITKEGRVALDEWLEVWKQTKKFVDTILKG
ncbi:MAG: PadR family transcriptional regulator [Chloroflexi bacterium]|nr:PadR family transcriptional regulator [Chloroflexota bacterium]